MTVIVGLFYYIDQSFDTANQRFSELAAAQEFSAISLAIPISGNK